MLNSAIPNNRLQYIHRSYLSNMPYASHPAASTDLNVKIGSSTIKYEKTNLIDTLYSQLGVVLSEQSESKSPALSNVE